jgi:hypothetical protein
MPPGLAEQARQSYELFCERHLPNFVDTPDAIRVPYIGKSFDFGYFDLNDTAQAALAIPFCSLVYLYLVDRMPRLKPIEKFARYLATLEEQIDLLGAKETEIARYCFANPPAASRQAIDLRRDVFRDNFMKTKEKKLPHDAAQLLKVAFNVTLLRHFVTEQENALCPATSTNAVRSGGGVSSLPAPTRDAAYERLIGLKRSGVSPNGGRNSKQPASLGKHEQPGRMR